MKVNKLALSLLVASLTLVAGSATAGGEIAVIVKRTNSTFWDNVKKGSTDIAPTLKGYTTSFDGPAAETDIADQVKLVENAISRKVAGIVLAPSDPDALLPMLKKAFDARIPVILIDSPVASSGRMYYQAMLSTDNVKAGAMAAKALIAKAGTTGKIAIMSYVAGAGSEPGRIKGFTDYIKAHSSLTIVGPFYSQAVEATAFKQTTDVLAANPDLKGLFGANEPTAVGMGRAIAKSGKAGKVVAIGFDGNSDLQNFVKDGTLEGIVVQSAYNMGALGVRTVVDVLEGQRVPPVLDTGAVYVNKANIAKPEATNVLY
jgi:ribose transport system substrate-binding protein